MSQTLLRYPKPELRAKVTHRARRRRAIDRTTCRAVVLARDGYRCRCGCGASSLTSALHVHEIRFRSLGGDPTDPHNCVVLAPSCHEHVQRHRWRVVPINPDLGANGLVEFRRGEEAWIR